MFMSRCAILSALLLLAMMTGASLAETPNLGKPIDEAAIAAWDISILPDGTGLPKGGGTPAQGAVIYAKSAQRVMATTERVAAPPPPWSVTM